jgi:lipopolysaccharide assembly outer membrane protein LptD (OstA)
MLCVSTTEAFSILPKDNLSDLSKQWISEPHYLDTTKAPIDSLLKRKQDSLNVKQKKQKDGIKTSVTYSSEDSIVFDAETQTMKLFKDSKITYGDMSLDAERIDINWRNSTVEATGVEDSTGKLIGSPVFKEKQDMYQPKKILYNFKTKKGIINEVITKQGDGLIHGEKVKKNEVNELFVEHSQYTTCNLAQPHYSISSSKIKVIPEKKIISGPFNLVINKVPTPLGFIFGYFPAPKTRASGFIIPTYGEQQTRGFYLQQGGYYWAVNDYLGMKFTADIYSLGGGGAQQITDYRKRYAYSGMFNFKYNWIKTYDNIDPTKKLDMHQFWVTWNHTTAGKKPGKLTININAGTSTYNQYSTTMQSTNQTLGNTFQSNISYSRTFRNSPFNIGLNLRQDQTTTGVKNFTLPDFSLNMNRVMPFQNIKGGKSTEALRKFNVRLTMNLQNKVTNDPNQIGYKDSAGVPSHHQMYTYNEDYAYLFSSKNLNNGVIYDIPLSTTFKVLKYFSVNPSFAYREYWYTRSFRYDSVVTDTNGQRVKKDTSYGFKRTYQYNFSTGLTTRVYGTYFLKIGRLEAIRHTLIPTFSYAYKPDFGSTQFDNYQHVMLNGKEQLFNRYQGAVFGSPGTGKTSSLGLQLSNTFEMKIRNKSDTATGKNKFQKVSLLDNVSLGGNYNFAVHEFNLSNITLAARTKLLKIFDIAFNANIDPYERENTPQSTDSTGYKTTPTITSNRINSLQFEHGKGIGNIANSNLAFGFALSSQKFKKTKKEDLKTRAEEVKASGADVTELERIKNNPKEYLDFNIPWNMNLSYNLTYTQLYVPGTAPDLYSHSVTFSGDISFTKKWKVQYTTGYSFTQKSVTYTRFGITRDLHCWVMSLNWIPPIPGSATSGNYSFQLNVKSSVLQDLKLSRNRTWTDVTQ